MGEQQIERIREGIRRVVRQDRKIEIQKLKTNLEGDLAQKEAELRQAQQAGRTRHVQPLMTQHEELKLVLEEIVAVLKLYDE